ncbi:MAG: LuxR C-terminal-related transcriptional regulator [Myxococcota bacterium]
MLERDSVVRERAQRLLEADGLAVCSTGSPELFEQIAQSQGFEWIVVGAAGAGDLAPLKLERLARLVLLVPGTEPHRLRSFRLRWPEAVLVDRRLEDPDCLRRAIGPSERPKAIAARGDPAREAFGSFGLSERQLEVLRAALLGAAPDAIGRDLFISERTVRNHLHAIYRATGTSGRRELLGRFVQTLLG